MGDNRAVADIDCDTGVLIRHSTLKRRRRSMGWFGSFFRRDTSHSAMSLYKRGMAKAKKHDHEGAQRLWQLRVIAGRVRALKNKDLRQEVFKLG